MSQIPEDVTAEDLARWRKQAEESGPPEAPMLRQVFPEYQPGDYRESWCAAEWLARTLDELGCDPELGERICFAQGQIAFHSDDPWKAAMEASANFRQGKWETPGPELAARLFEEHFQRLREQFGPPDLTVLRTVIASPEFKKPIPHPFPYDPV